MSCIFYNAEFINVTFRDTSFKGIVLNNIEARGIKGVRVFSCQLVVENEVRTIQYWPDLDVASDSYFLDVKTFKELKEYIEALYNNKEDKETYLKYQVVFNYITMMQSLS